MSLLEVRKMLVKQSGRYDLITSATTFANNPDGPGGGADFYIQSGQDFLDRRSSFYKEEAELEISLVTSAFTSILTNVRVIRGVALFDDQDDEMVFLKKTSLRVMRERFGDENSSLASVSKGQPNQWTMGYLRSEASSNPTTEQAIKLVVMPPADRTYTLRLQVMLKSSALTSDSSVSFWTEAHPQLLVLAALYRLEIGYRNKEGARALLASIDEDLEGIDNDLVEQEIVEQTHPRSQFRFITTPRRGYERHIS